MTGPPCHEAVLDGGWPTLDEAEGKVLFLMDNGGELRDLYRADRPSLEGRVLFTNAEPGDDDAAFVKVNEPIGNVERIQALVEAGYVVRTRSDVPTEQARSNDTTQRDAALASGAQWVSTDYPVPGSSPFSPYFAAIPDGQPARCNPVNTGPRCDNALLEVIEPEPRGHHPPRRNPEPRDERGRRTSKRSNAPSPRPCGCVGRSPSRLRPRRPRSRAASSSTGSAGPTSPLLAFIPSRDLGTGAPAAYALGPTTVTVSATPVDPSGDGDPTDATATVELLDLASVQAAIRELLDTPSGADLQVALRRAIRARLAQDPVFRQRFAMSLGR